MQCAQGILKIISNEQGQFNKFAKPFARGVRGPIHNCELILLAISLSLFYSLI